MQDATELPAAQSVTIFSNGVADFRRIIPVKAGTPTQLNIPINSEYIGDILDSLHVYGNVEYEKPVNYRPSNDKEGTLEITTTGVIADLIIKLSGAEVSIEKINGSKLAGVLVGMDSETAVTIDNKSVVNRYVVVMTDQSIQRIRVDGEIKTIQFTDKAVQAEITKALQRNYQKIKPHSTFVDLSLRASSDTDAILRYAYPNAAWTMTYSLRKITEGWEFQASAVVPNKTDEDWNELYVSVVTGEPTTFSTDLAESKIPRRQHINVVKEEAQGAVEAELGFGATLSNSAYGGRGTEAMSYTASGLAGAAVACAAPASARKMMLRSATKGGGQEYAAESINMVSADFEQAVAREVGDFSEFTSSSPLTIPAKRSALIPLFTKVIDGAKAVLYYKVGGNPHRPLRAIQFYNKTGHALTSGPCVIDQENLFQGKCIMPAMKADENCLLPHALETGVRVRRDQAVPTEKITNIRISKGVYYKEVKHTVKTTVLFKNFKDEAFEVLVDHNRDFSSESTFKLSLEGSKAEHPIADTLSNGIRTSVKLTAKGEVTLKVIETTLVSQEINLSRNNWLRYIGEDKNKALHTPELIRCLEIQKKIEANNELEQKAQAERKAAEAKQARIISLLKADTKDEDQRGKWTKTLGDTEQTITKIDEVTLPELEAAGNVLEEQLDAALLAITTEAKE
jgi:hypothetical protein